MLPTAPDPGAHSPLLYNIAEVAGAGIAAAATTSPIWRSEFHAASNWATEAAPIFGVAWLAVQIAYRITHWLPKPKD